MIDFDCFSEFKVNSSKKWLIYGKLLICFDDYIIIQIMIYVNI